jgi:hypothetical protein
MRISLQAVTFLACSKRRKLEMKVLFERRKDSDGFIKPFNQTRVNKSSRVVRRDVGECSKLMFKGGGELRLEGRLLEASLIPA